MVYFQVSTRGALMAIILMFLAFRASAVSSGQKNLQKTLVLDSALLALARRVGYNGIPEATQEAVIFGVTGPKATDKVRERVYPRAEATLDVAWFTPGQDQAVWAAPGDLFELYCLPAAPAVVRKLLLENRP